MTTEPKQGRASIAVQAMPGAEAPTRERPIPGAKAAVWTERMLSALVNGVRGDVVAKRAGRDGRKWFSLMDKVYAPKTLALAWMKVRDNKGAAGVDGQSIERFAAAADKYLAELSAVLRDGTYRPQAVKRVDIPKGQIFFALRARGAGRGRWAFRRSRIVSSNRLCGS